MTERTRPKMSNETVKKFEITIKLRGDNVYDLYIDNAWIASRGSYEGALDEAGAYIKQSFLENK